MNFITKKQITYKPETMKTTIQWLKEYLETKVLPCSEDNEYVYGMNVAHNNLIHYMIPYLLEKEKEQIIAPVDRLCDFYGHPHIGEQMYNTWYVKPDLKPINQNNL